MKAKFVLFVEKSAYDLYVLYAKGDRTDSSEAAYNTISRSIQEMHVAGVMNGLFMEQAVEVQPMS